MHNGDYSLVTIHAKVVDKMYFFGKQKERYFKERDFINKVIEEENLGKEIIDAGCGTGIHLMLFSELGYVARGFDLRKDMVDVAKKRNPSLEIIQGDMRKFPLKGNSDVIICMYGAINYLDTEEGLEKTFNNFYKHLKDKGVAIIDTRYYKNLDEKVYVWSNQEYTLAKRWIKSGDNIGIYRVFYSMPSEGIMEMEDHLQYFQDPFLIGKELEKAGFDEIKIFDNYDINSVFTKNTDSYKPVVVGIKNKNE